MTAPSFTVTSTCGDARCGVLRLPSGTEVATPAVLGYTRRGAPLHLTHDVLTSLPPEARLLGVQPLAFAGEAPTAAVVAAAGGLASFAGLAGCVLVASCREPYAYDAAVVAKNASTQGNDAGLPVSTQAGSRRISPAVYADILAALRCDVAIALADEPLAGETSKRQRLCAERTHRWLLDLRGVLTLKAPGLLPTLWASIQGGSDVDERQRAAQAAAAVPVSGFSLGGFSTGEVPDARLQLIAACVSALPPSLPRHIGGMNSPEEILQAVSCGVAVFEGGYAHATTAQGCALVFPVGPHGHVGDTAVSPGNDGVKVNLRALAFTLDQGPLCRGCTCFACARHTRAYVHHLLDTHEMLADILLDVHNVHHMLRFFAALREAVAAGTLQQFRDFHDRRLQDVREAHAAAALDEC